MKISADRKQLLDALSVCTSISRGGRFSALENVRLTSWEQEIGGALACGLTVEATNLSETLRFHLPGEAEGAVSPLPGPILVNAARLRSYLAAEEADRVTMEVKEGKTLHLKGKRSLSLRLPGDSFPELPALPAGEPTAILDQEALFSALRRASGFRGEGKQASPGSILLRAAGGLLGAYSTNGHRLYRELAVRDCPENLGLDVEVRVSPGLAKLLLACADEAGEVAVYLGTTQDAWTLPGVEIFSLRDEEKHGRYDDLLERLEGDELDLSAEVVSELRRSVEAALVIGEESRSGVAGSTLDLTYDGKEGALIVSMVSAHGSAREDIEVPALGGAWRFSTFKGRDLVQALEVLAGPVRMTKAGDGRGLKLDSLGEDGKPGETTVYLTEVKR